VVDGVGTKVGVDVPEAVGLGTGLALDGPGFGVAGRVDEPYTMLTGRGR